ncbi:hypothetical protein Ddye_005285, partial [Dipteronia dyeriana]
RYSLTTQKLMQEVRRILEEAREKEFCRGFNASLCTSKWKHTKKFPGVQLPEIYIGKLDFVNAIVRILCNAAKKSMKEKKNYMGPWRKKSFKEMKWSSSLERKPFDDDSWNNKSTN